MQNLLDEHMRFFHSPVEISFSVLFLVSIFILYRKLKPQRNLVCYLAVLVITLALFSVHKSSKYMLIYLPYMVILISGLINELPADKCDASSTARKYPRLGKQLGLGFVILLYLFFNIQLDASIATEKYKGDPVEPIINRYLEKPAGECRLLAPMEFIFSGMEKLKSIQSELAYSEMLKSNKAGSKIGFLQIQSNFDIDYIILSEEYISQLGMDKVSPAELITNNLEVLYRGKQFMILKKQKNP